VVLVLDGPATQEVPDGWTLREEAPALTVYLQTEREGFRRALSALEGDVPARARAGTPFLRADPARGLEGQVQLVLPLLASP
jgi:hypothetical protein